MKKLTAILLVFLGLVAGYFISPTIDKTLTHLSLSTKAEMFKREHQRAFLRCDARCEAYNATWKPEYERMVAETNAVFN